MYGINKVRIGAEIEKSAYTSCVHIVLIRCTIDKEDYNHIGDYYKVFKNNVCLPLYQKVI